jgi:hypothetical protein
LPAGLPVANEEILIALRQTKIAQEATAIANAMRAKEEEREKEESEWQRKQEALANRPVCIRPQTRYTDPGRGSYWIRSAVEMTE